MAFNKTGDYLTLGDNAGRLIVFQQNTIQKAKKRYEEFNYITEIQSHYKDFDYLKSVDIEERINSIEWLYSSNNSLLMLSTNDKTIKLWKLSNKTIKRCEPFQNKKAILIDNLAMPTLRQIDQGYVPSLKRTFANLHVYHINSLSASLDGENFISSDDLNIFLWNLE